MSNCGDLQRRLLAVILEAEAELDEDSLDAFLRTCVAVVATAVSLRWDKARDRPEGWA